MGEYIDDMAAQATAAAVAFPEHGRRFGPPYHEHACPGCQPRPTDAEHGAAWDRWHAIQQKWIVKINEPSACPIARGETLPPVVPQVRPTLPHPDELCGARKRAEPTAAQAVAEEPAETTTEVAPAKVRVQRARKAKEVSKGQGSLF